jgi:ABC-2 type transport system permease protein
MWRRIGSIIQKELVQIFRDRRTLTIQLSLPIIMLFIFGYAVGTQVDHQRTVVVDQSHDSQSRAFTQAMVNTSFFDVIDYLDNEKEAMRAIERGDAAVAIVIPPGMERKIDRGEIAQILVLIDGSDTMASQSALNATLSTAQDFSVELTTKQIERAGGIAGGSNLALLDVAYRVLYNPDMKSIVFMVPALVGLIMQQQAVTLTAMAIVREREMGTLEQILVTPIRTWELMLGKIVPNVLITFANIATVLVIGIFWFGVPFQGSMLLFWGLAFLFVFASLGLGILISTISSNQNQAQQMAMVIIMPAVMISGFMYPRELMPWPIQFLSNFLPLTHFLEISRGIMTKGVGMESLYWPIAFLAVQGILIFALASRSFHSTLD